MNKLKTRAHKILGLVNCSGGANNNADYTPENLFQYDCDPIILNPQALLSPVADFDIKAPDNDSRTYASLTPVIPLQPCQITTCNLKDVKRKLFLNENAEDALAVSLSNSRREIITTPATRANKIISVSNSESKSENSALITTDDNNPKSPKSCILVTAEESPQHQNLSNDSDTDYIPDSEEDVEINNLNKKGKQQLPKQASYNVETSNCFLPVTIEGNPQRQNLESDCDSEYIPDSEEDSEGNNSHRKRRQECPTQTVDETVDHNNMNTISSETADTAKKPRKRLRKPETWKRNLKRKLSLSGSAHISKKKTVAAKSLKESCGPCRKKCSEKICEEQRKQIFKRFWCSDMTWELKRQFILSCVKEQPIQRRRVKSDDGIPKKTRNTTYRYSFRNNNENTEVCQKFFLNTLSISITFVTNSIKLAENGIVLKDKRGNKEPPNKIPEDIKDRIRKHIMKFPKYESHYSRAKTQREYLGGHLNVEQMYKSYLEEFLTNGEETKGKTWLYRHIFNNEFNLGFKPPNIDTCDDCDNFAVHVRELNGSEMEEVKRKQEDHINAATKRYTLKTLDKLYSQENDSNCKMITVDLQKCLPTPLLTNGQSFYLRKLWTFNYTILDSTDNKCTCIMWDESISGRGGNEMASGLVKWFQNNVLVNPSVKEVIIWSDNCAGQNKNMHLVACYLWLLHVIPHLESITHKYLMKGHTHMEVDGIHSLIERKRNRQEQFSIVTPWDWQQVVKSCSTSNLPIEVVNMEVEDFKNFALLHEGASAPFIHRKKGISGEIVPYADMVHIFLKKSSYGTLHYKTSFEANTFKDVSLIRNKRKDLRDLRIPQSLVQIRRSLKPISTKKYEDLQKALQWIPRMLHQFYKNLPHSNNAEGDIPEAI